MENQEVNIQDKLLEYKQYAETVATRIAKDLELFELKRTFLMISAQINSWVDYRVNIQIL